MSTWSLNGMDMTAGLPSCSSRIPVVPGVQNRSWGIVGALECFQLNFMWVIALALRLKVAREGPA